MSAVLPARTASSAGGNLSALAIELESGLFSESLKAFVQGAWPVLEPGAELRWGWALDAICEHLEAVTSGDIQYLLMNVPPGCMKSLMTGVFWPAWEWTKHRWEHVNGKPRKVYTHRHLRYLGTAHKQDLAVRDTLKCRRLITSSWYQARWPIRLMSDQNAKLKFENEDTGFREAMAFQSMTGSRGDRVILDDPLSVDQGNSEAELLSAERTFTEALPTRVNNDKSAIVVIMQRLHESDTSGIIIDRKLGYEHLMLPMRFEPERRCRTSIGFVDPRTKDGELLFPERFPEHEVHRLEKTMGSYATAGQMQQRPTPRGGGMFKEKYLQLWGHDKQLPILDFVLQSYDTATTENTQNDPTACTVWGFFRHGQRKAAILLESWDDFLKYSDVRTRILRDWRATYGGVAGQMPNSLNRPRRADAILVENKSSGIGVLQELNDHGVPAISYNPGKADKFGRASQALPIYESYAIYVIESKKEPGKPVTWARPFVSELHKFGPGVAARDDYVDTFSQMCIYARDNGLLDIDFNEEPPPHEAEYAPRKRNPYD